MSERPWIEHTGQWPRPSELVVGVTAQLRYRGIGVSVHQFCLPITATPPNASRWHWTGAADDIVAYRIINSPQAEMDRISARQDMFRKIAEEAVKTDRPVKAPKKVGA